MLVKHTAARPSVTELYISSPDINAYTSAPNPVKNAVGRNTAGTVEYSEHGMYLAFTQKFTNTNKSGNPARITGTRIGFVKRYTTIP